MFTIADVIEGSTVKQALRIAAKVEKRRRDAEAKRQKRRALQAQKARDRQAGTRADGHPIRPLAL